MAIIVERIPLTVCVIGQDVSLGLEAPADVRVHLAEPASELRILIGITVDVVDRVNHIIQTSVIGKSLNQGLNPKLVPTKDTGLGY